MIRMKWWNVDIVVLVIQKWRWYKCYCYCCCCLVLFLYWYEVLLLIVLLPAFLESTDVLVNFVQWSTLTCVIDGESIVVDTLHHCCYCYCDISFIHYDDNVTFCLFILMCWHSFWRVLVLFFILLIVVATYRALLLYSELFVVDIFSIVSVVDDVTDILFSFTEEYATHLFECCWREIHSIITCVLVVLTVTVLTYSILMESIVTVGIWYLLFIKCCYIIHCDAVPLFLFCVLLPIYSMMMMLNPFILYTAIIAVMFDTVDVTMFYEQKAVLVVMQVMMW